VSSLTHIEPFASTPAVRAGATLSGSLAPFVLNGRRWPSRSVAINGRCENHMGEPNAEELGDVVLSREN